MRRLTKQEIANARPLPTEDVLTPEWAPADFSPEDTASCFVTVRALNARERDAFEASLIVGEGKRRQVSMVNARAKLIGLCMVDDKGRRTHTEAEALTLGEQSAAAADRVFTVCQRLAGLTAEDVEDLTKNSAPALNGSSPSISVSSLDSPTPTNSKTDSPAAN